MRLIARRTISLVSEQRTETWRPLVLLRLVRDEFVNVGKVRCLCGSLGVLGRIDFANELGY